MSDPLTDDLQEELGDRIAEAMTIAGDPQAVPVNMYEAEGALVILAALPGVMADDVEVEVEPARVRIRAAMRTPAPKDYLLHEWHYGPYDRVVDIPPGFSGRASGTFGNGQLALRITRDGDATVGRLALDPAR